MKKDLFLEYSRALAELYEGTGVEVKVQNGGNRACVLIGNYGENEAVSHGDAVEIDLHWQREGNRTRHHPDSGLSVYSQSPEENGPCASLRVFDRWLVRPLLPNRPDILLRLREE